MAILEWVQDILLFVVSCVDKFTKVSSQVCDPEFALVLPDSPSSRVKHEPFSTVDGFRVVLAFINLAHIVVLVDPFSAFLFIIFDYSLSIDIWTLKFFDRVLSLSPRR